MTYNSGTVELSDDKTPLSQPNDLINTLNTVIPADWALTPVKGKQPYTLKWQTTDLDRQFIANEIRSGKAVGIGLRLGKPSGYVVAIDFDGQSAIELGLSKFGELPTTVTWTSGRPGRYQALFQVPTEYQDKFKNKKIETGTIGDDGKAEQIEFRYTGNQSVLPPSTHPKTDGYKWIHSPEDTEIAPLPDKVLTYWKEAISKPTRSTKTTPKKAGRPPLILPEVKEKIGSYNGRIPANLKSDLERQLSNVIKAAGGDKNVQLRNASLALGRMSHNGLDRETAFVLLVWGATANGKYIEKPKECDGTINGGLNDGENSEPWRIENQSKDYKSISRQPVSIKDLMIETFSKLYSGQAIRFNKRLECWEIGKVTLSANDFLLKFAESINYRFTSETSKMAAQLLSTDENIAYDPITEYLNSLKATNNYHQPITINQLASLFSITEIEAKLMRRWLISACARAYQPGCKADLVLLLRGEQGVGKSSFFKWLAGGDDYYHSGGIGSGDKDITIANNMCWINELEEVDRYTSKREASDIKSEISRSADRLRRPYAAEHEFVKRGFIFGASTNKDTPLVDENNRRWLSIHIAKDIKLQLTSELRDSILGMCVSAYDDGENWWLNSEEEINQTEINKEYTEENIYSEKLLLGINRAVKSNPRIIFLVDTCIEYLEEKRSIRVRNAVK